VALPRAEIFPNEYKCLLVEIGRIKKTIIKAFDHLKNEFAMLWEAQH